MANRIASARLADQMRDYLARWLQEDFPGAFLTVTAVTFSPNGHEATAWLAVGAPQGRRHLTSALKKREYYAHRMARELDRRRAPQLKFVVGNGDILAGLLDDLD